MAEYPPTPAFGISPSGGIPPQQRKTSHSQPYDYRDMQKNSLSEYHRTQTEDAFHSNGRITGFSAAAVASGIPPLPIYETHDFQMYPYPPGPYGRDARFESPGSKNSYPNPSKDSPVPKISHITPQGNRATSSHISTYQVEEEGELSEGEFEEAPQKIRPGNATMFRNRERHEQRPPDQHDHAYRSNYDSSGELVSTSHVLLTDIYGRSLDLNKPRSESYSPYEPPNEIEYEPPSGPGVFLDGDDSPYHDPYGRADDFSHVQVHQKGSYQKEFPRVGSFHSPGAEYSPREPLYLTSEAHFGSTATSANRAPVKSLLNARKEAQSAILNLLPLKVRYRDYVEEGIDEEVVRRQFESLGMPQANIELPSHKSGNLSHRQISSNVSTTTTKSNNLNTAGAVSSTVSEKTDRLPIANNHEGEERKDRIARLLAENKKKQGLSAMRLNSPTTSASPDASTAAKVASPSQLAAKADKERLLRQKMEALQKSREQRAQKAAAKSATAAPPVNGDSINTTELSTGTSSSRQSKTDHQSSRPESQKSTSPAATTSNKPKMASIPGLFLAARSTMPAAPSACNFASSSISNGLQRKRPVASDFDRPPSAELSYKRPFGQNRNDQPLVIDVSDEDSEDGDFSEMDINHSQPEAPDISLNGTSNAKTKAVRELPPLSELPPRRVFPTPNSAASTPPAPPLSLKPSTRKPEDLQKKEMEIQAMRKKIAEAERRKRAKQNMSGSQTPRSNDSTSSPAKSGNAPTIADKIEASVQIEQLIDNASRQVHQNQAKLAAAHAAEEIKVDELKQSSAERRRLRRAEIASGLPFVDAEVEIAQQRLADLRAEVAKFEAAVKKSLNEKKRLTEEMEKLGQEADEQLHVQKARLDELTLEDPNRTTVHRAHDSPSVSEFVVDLPSVNKVSRTSSAAIDAKNSHTVDTSLTADSARQIDLVSSGTNGLAPVQPAVIPRIPTEDFDETTKTLCEPPRGASPTKGVLEKSEGDVTHLIPNQTMESALQETSAEGAVDSERTSESDVEMVDTYAPNPEVLAPASTQGSPGTNPHESSHIDSSDDISNGGDYEPPDATPHATDGATALNSPQFSPAPPRANSRISPREAHQKIASPPKDSALPVSATHKDDIPFLSVQSKDSPPSVEAPRSFFTPYESPLKYFRAFRYHPSFKQEVDGGFKSLTFSNNIKEDLELCRYELAGGVCNDATCEYQHFKDMGLADDAILLELGNSAGYNEEDKPRFVAGLRTVLQGLRTKKTNEFKVIASEIAAYRASFLGDQSKVLLLEDTPV